MKKILALVLMLIVAGHAFADVLTSQMFLIGRGLIVLDESQMTQSEDASSDSAWMKDLKIAFLTLSSDSIPAIGFTDNGVLYAAFNMASLFGGNTGTSNDGSIVNAFVDFCNAFDFDVYYAVTNGSDNIYWYSANDITASTGIEIPLEQQRSSKESFIEAVRAIDLDSLSSESEETE